MIRAAAAAVAALPIGIAHGNRGDTGWLLLCLGLALAAWLIVMVEYAQAERRRIDRGGGGP